MDSVDPYAGRIDGSVYIVAFEVAHKELKRITS